MRKSLARIIFKAKFLETPTHVRTLFSFKKRLRINKYLSRKTTRMGSSVEIRM